MAELRMHPLDMNGCCIADTFDCRVRILDWIQDNGHRIRRCFDGMFSPADSAPALLQILGIDSYLTGITARTKHKHYSRLTHRSGFTPFQVFCYEDEVPTIKKLVSELSEEFPFDGDEFEDGGEGAFSAQAQIGAYRIPLPRREYAVSLIKRAPELRRRLSAVFPNACKSAVSEIENAADMPVDSMSESELREAAGRILEKMVSADVFEEGVSLAVSDAEVEHGGATWDVCSQSKAATIATWLTLVDEQHVVSGLQEVMEDPFLVLMSLQYRGEEPDQELIDTPLRQDTILRRYMSSYIYAILFGFRCIRCSYDDYLYRLYSSRIWEMFALCGKEYVQNGDYDKLAARGMKKLGYPTSTRTLENVVDRLHWTLVNDRSED